MKTILIADDDDDDIEFLCNAIREVDNSFEVVSVSDGVQALQYLKVENHPLPLYIFMDLNMPKLGGIECFKKIRAIPPLIDVPVILYSTSKQKEQIDKVQALGNVYFVTKPYKSIELKQLVSVILRNDWKTLIEKVI